MYIYIYRWVYKFTCWSILFSNNGSLPGHTRTSVVAHIHTLTITRTHSHFHSHLHIVIHTLSFTLVRHMLIITHSNHSDRANSHTFSHTFYKTHILIHFHPTILLDPTTYSVPHVFVFALSFNHSFRHPSTDQWSKWCTLYRVQCKYRIL